MKVFGEKGLNSSRQVRKVLQKRSRGIEEKCKKEDSEGSGGEWDEWVLARLWVLTVFIPTMDFSTLVT